MLTILVGENAEGVDDLVAFVQEQHPELEVEVHDGGQPHYPFCSAPNRPILCPTWQAIRSPSSSSRTTTSSASRSSSCSAPCPTWRSSRPCPTGERARRLPALQPDVVLMDYRLPELDGVETTAAIGEGLPGDGGRRPHGDGGERGDRRPLRGRRGRLSDEGPRARRDRRRREDAAGAMQLSAENTAIVLDSTADCPTRRRAIPTGAWCRSTCASATRRSGSTSTSRRRSSTPPEGRARAAEELPADAGRLRGGLRGARGLREDPRGAALRAGSPERTRARGSAPSRSATSA